MQNTLVIIFLSASTLFFLYKLVSLYMRSRRVQTSQTWPQINGSVTEAHVRSTRNNSKSQPHYFGEVSYAYIVMGNTYAGMFKKDSFFSSQKTALQVVNDFPAGTSVPVRYNPDKPQEAVTENDQVKTSEWVQAIGFLLLMAAVTIFYLSVTL